MDEERHETILEMREERKSARDKMRKERGLLKSNDEHSIHELHITDTNDLLHHYRTDRDSSRHLFDEKRTEIHKRQQHRRSSFPMENLKSISKEDSNADLDRIVDEYKSEGISFSYSGLKRNSKGEIIKIKLRLNNNNGSNSQSHYDGDGEAIKTIYVGSDGQTTIMTTKK
jgi:hypothetical protein